MKGNCEETEEDRLREHSEDTEEGSDAIESAFLLQDIWLFENQLSPERPGHLTP